MAALSLTMLLIAVVPHVNRRPISPYVTFCLKLKDHHLLAKSEPSARLALRGGDRFLACSKTPPHPRVPSTLRLPALVDMPALDEPVVVTFAMAHIWQMRCIGSSLPGFSTSPQSPWRRPPHTPWHTWPSGASDVRP